jgi:hypothetical protein
MEGANVNEFIDSGESRWIKKTLQLLVWLKYTGLHCSGACGLPADFQYFTLCTVRF